MSLDINCLLDIAKMWQRVHNRNPLEAIGKMEDEVVEFKEAQGNRIAELDELGDVLVCAMRTLVSLSPNELEFLYSVSRMKAERRLVYPGVKDKEAEAEETLKIAKRLGITK